LVCSPTVVPFNTPVFSEFEVLWLLFAASIPLACLFDA
jgi:hypothetical protein